MQIPLGPSHQIFLEEPFHGNLKQVGRMADISENHIKSTSLVNRENHVVKKILFQNYRLKSPMMAEILNITTSGSYPCPLRIPPPEWLSQRLHQNCRGNTILALTTNEGNKQRRQNRL
jgi:hypothetical protein